TFPPVRKNITIVIQKNSLKKLQIQADIPQQTEIQSQCIINGILPHQTIQVSWTSHIEATPVCINEFPLEYSGSQVFGHRPASLINFIMTGLKHQRITRQTDPVKSGSGIKAVIIKC